MDWVQTLSIMATVIASAYYIHKEVQADIHIANSRTDMLYEMYCENQKDLRQMFYDTQKEMKQLHIDFIQGRTSK